MKNIKKFGRSHGAANVRFIIFFLYIKEKKEMVYNNGVFNLIIICNGRW